MTNVKIHGYSDQISVAPGESIRFMVSVEGADRYQAQLVRLIHGDTNPNGPGYKEVEIASPINQEYAGRYQAIYAGSYVRVDDRGGATALTDDFSISAFICPTTPLKGAQCIAGRWLDSAQAGYALVLDEQGRVALWLGDGGGAMSKTSVDTPLVLGVWHAVAATHDASSGAVTLLQRPVLNGANSHFGPAMPMPPPAFEESRSTVNLATADAPFLIAAFTARVEGDKVIPGGHFNGKIDRPRLFSRALSREELELLADGEAASRDGLVADWDFAATISRDGIPSDPAMDVSGNELHGTCVNMPARAMTGWNWTGRDEVFTVAPEQYGAIHFHDDDVYDAGWEPDFELTLPAGMKSDVYAVRLRSGDGEEHLPFCVLPPRGTATAKILFLVPTASYMAYANQHLALDAMLGQAILGHTPIVGEQDLYLYAHNEYGLSNYDLHTDFSGVCHSSRLRPIIDMRPKHRHSTGWVWQFPADLHLTDWLQAMGHQYDVATDEDLHREGAALLKRYNVVMSGSHPEYTSTAMLDGIEQYLAEGGRFMYLGANGFYWIISYPTDKPGVIEVRRAESGSRAWQARPGEYYHSSTAERGGLWRNRARAPQKIFGVGFSSEGFDYSTHYRRMPDSFDPRASWILDGVGEDEKIGDFGLCGDGAAGLELDKYDLTLGTPAHALLLASSEGLSDIYQRVVEEIYFNHPGMGATQDPQARADIVFFETPNGGAVFSTGSIAWCGSLSHNGYANNVSRIQDNVLRRFAQDGPLT